MAHDNLLTNLGSLYFWLVAYDSNDGDWLDWLIGNEITHTHLNLQRKMKCKTINSE